MRNSFLAITFIMSWGVSHAQNMVHNPGFEQMVMCPTSVSQFTPAYVVEWDRGINSGSTDYFNACNPYIGVGIPQNFAGYQAAYEGNAYCGLFTKTAPE